MTTADAVRALRLHHRSGVRLRVRAGRLVAASARGLRGALRIPRPIEVAGAQPAHRLGIRSSASSRSASTGSRRPLPINRTCRPGSAGSRSFCLSLYLAIYPALATGLAWRFGRDNRVVLVLVLGGAWTITEWLRGDDVHRIPVEPRGSRARADTADHRHSAHRDLRLVRPGGPARRRRVARILQEVAAAGDDPRRNLAALGAAVVVGPGGCADDRQRPHRPAQYRSAGQVAPRLCRRGRAAARHAIRPAERGTAAADVARSRDHRSGRGCPHRRAPGDGAVRAHPRGVACSDPTTGC